MIDNKEACATYLKIPSDSTEQRDNVIFWISIINLSFYPRNLAKCNFLRQSTVQSLYNTQIWI